MDKNEVIKAIERRNPQRLPCLYGWMAAETMAKYKDAAKDLLQAYQDDLILEAISFSPSANLTQTEWRDEWGITWRRSPAAGAMGVNSELRDWNALNHYLKEGFPDLDLQGRFDHITETVAKNPNTYVIATWWLCQLEIFRALRGTENFLMDLYLHQRELMTLGEALTDFFIRLIRKLAKCGADGVMLSDDFGTQHSLLFSPKHWRQLFKPWYKRMIREIHYHGMHALLHTCGYIEDIIPDFVELGLDVLHLGNPYLMDIEKIVNNFKEDICFFGGCDVQSLSKKKPEEIRRDVERAVKLFGSKEGGFILAPTNSITPDVSLENIEALFRAMKKYSSFYS